MKMSGKCYLLLKHLLYARRSQAEDFESRYLAAYGHPDSAEYLFIRHLYDLLPRASGPGERYLAYQGRSDYAVMYPPHIWDCDGDIGIDRGGFGVVTTDYGYALKLLKSFTGLPKIGLGKAVGVFMTDLSGPDWAQALDLIIVHERHFVTPMKLTEALVRHYLQSFHTQPSAGSRVPDASNAAPAAPALLADASPKVALDLDLMGRIDRQDGWI
jgi:hypothetical protein